ncbi:cytoskeleton-associated 4 [Labeo rohita]|uniref:Cytoskeleton-associated 4 n=1 Tax=Labeo rohita TaxID=84645 RepID=A0A498L1I1_LABRO|nr:cytoskeleton-associated 4 [Labeo rohita]
MTAKNRNKNNSQPNNDKTLGSPQPEDAPKNKSPKVAKADNATGSGGLMKFLSALTYLVFVIGTVIVSLCFYQELSDIKQTNSRYEESVKKCADAEHALQQVRSMKASLESLESQMLTARTDLERTSRAVQKGEADTRRMEDSFQKLQNKISQELTQGIQEAKDAGNKDISSLERTMEERLAQLSRSIAESTAEFASQQSQYKNELLELKARLEEKDTPALIKQELTSLSRAVAILNTASEVAEGNVAVLREQIAAVGAELQTRNKEVASVSEDVEAVRTVVQSAVRTLRDEVSAARASAQTASDQLQGLNERLEQSSGALQSLEISMREELLKVDKRREDVDIRLKGVEENVEALESSLSEQTNRLSALTTKHESHENSLANYKTAAEKERQTLRDGLDGLRSSLEELETRVSETQEQKQELDQEKEAVEVPENEDL